MKLSSILYSCVLLQASLNAWGLPSSFDLRSVNGNNFVSKVKKQSGGTCWTHGTMAALESNLLMNGQWQHNGESGEPNLAEYHLDWWNGFNQHFNFDINPNSAGLTVHEGGDYRVAAAYLSRRGAVREVDGQSFSSAPKQFDSSFHTYYVRDIEWFSAGSQNENIDKIKNAVMTNGVVGTALDWDDNFFDSDNSTFYQPPSSEELPNHAVAIVGWDDNKVTSAPKKGAWLIKNSWGTGFGESGYFWISYYDKTSGHHPQMGAVSFKNVEPLKYNKIYTLDYHGWRDTLEGVTEAFNAFTAEGGPKGVETLRAVSFISANDDVDYIVSVYRNFNQGQLSSLVSLSRGTLQQTGFHTVDLETPVLLNQGDKFYVKVSLSKGGHAFDKTSDVPVLLGGSSRTIVESRAKAGESFYNKNGSWVDLTTQDKSANFCIKALTDDYL